MRFETYVTSTGLNGTNGKIRRGIAEELDEQAKQGKIAIADFFRVSDDVYVFKDKDVKNFRIDCNEAKDKIGYAEGDTVFYLQLQKDRLTFANVIYPQNAAITLTDLINGIKMSLNEGKGVRILN